MLDALNFYDDGVQPETEYTYTVIALDDEGRRSDLSTAVFTTPSDLPAGEAPANTADLISGGSARWIYKRWS